MKGEHGVIWRNEESAWRRLKSGSGGGGSSSSGGGGGGGGSSRRGAVAVSFLNSIRIHRL